MLIRDFGLFKASWPLFAEFSAFRVGRGFIGGDLCWKVNLHWLMEYGFYFFANCIGWLSDCNNYTGQPQQGHLPERQLEKLFQWNGVVRYIVPLRYIESARSFSSSCLVLPATFALREFYWCNHCAILILLRPVLVAFDIVDEIVNAAGT